MSTKVNYRYIKKNFDSIAVMAVFTKVTLGKYSELSIDDNAVIQALRRSANELEGASLEKIGEYLSSMNSNSINGIVNNVQGILHEVEWVNLENSDGDSVVVGMFPDTNHRDYDIWAYDKDTGEYWVEQLKATGDKSEVRDWIKEHPDGTIRVDEDMAEELGLPTTGLDREDLRARVEDVVDKLKDSSVDDSIWDYLPGLTALSVALVVWELHKRYKSEQITVEEFKRMAARATGLKVAKIGMLMVLLSIPIVNVITGTTIVYQLIRSGQEYLDN